MLHELSFVVFEFGSRSQGILPFNEVFEGIERRKLPGVQRVNCSSLCPIGVPDLERAKIDFLRLSALV